jgi:bifunctional enzyme CysN/CysC
MNDLRVVVVGHVDHGKSTIIGRLLYETGSLPQRVADRFDATRPSCNAAAYAFLTDQLSEEQEGGFTLDTAQARLHTAPRDYTLIDTPGHQELLRNMVTGATRADAAILVVDAVEGPCPQTYLHAYLVAMLGIHRVIIAINKMDLIAYDCCRFRHLSQELSRHLERMGIAPIAVIPLSARQGDNIVVAGENMPWNLTPTLAETLDELIPPDREPVQPLRFLVQCRFPADHGPVILGKVLCGTLRRGQTIVFGPIGRDTIVTSVMTGSQEIPQATTGQCVGILLQNAGSVERGHVGFDGHTPPIITDQLAARVFWISPQPLERNAEVGVLCGTQDCRGRVERVIRLIDPVSLAAIETGAARLNDSQVAEVIIAMNSLICVDSCDITPGLGRFALLQGGRIGGGGVVIDQQHARL